MPCFVEAIRFSPRDPQLFRRARHASTPACRPTITAAHPHLVGIDRSKLRTDNISGIMMKLKVAGRLLRV
jgi:hypothetical protein